MKVTSLGLLFIVSALAGCGKADKETEAKLKELTDRVAKLEEAQKGLSEVDSFIRPIMEQQKAQQAQQEAAEPDPDARFAVDITGNDFHGPATAAVTIIEAFDFA
jgi:hypothetical protein